MAMLPKMPLILFLILLDASSSSPTHHLSTTFLPNYNNMLHAFKIHVYNHTPPSSITYQDQTASHFYNLLLRSPFLTSDPNQAHLFFLPFSSHLSSRPIARLVREIRTELPYWNRTLGADHFYISCNEFGHGSSDRNLVELKKNSIQISCFPTTKSSSNFIPHKDITLPPLNAKVNTVNDSVNDELVNDKEITSKYCPLFYEDGSVERIGSSLRAGCVPVVVVVDGSGAVGQDLPMMDVVRWGEVAVFVRNGTSVEEVRRVVRARGGGYERMRELGVAAAQHLEWDGGEERYGAFWSVMYQLWIRRHVIRYGRVESS